MNCRVCEHETQVLGEKQGKTCTRAFHFRHCPNCRFSFVEDPWLDFDQIYSEAYYEGRGADPLVDYTNELNHPDTTVRQYEWRGIVEAVEALGPVPPGTRWLDYGCGSGGLVRYLRKNSSVDIVGFETGAMVPEMIRRGIPVVQESDLAGMRGTLDVITMIEVIEHIPDPVSMLREVRSLLKPGGRLFLTTGNAEPFRNNLLEWRYVTPEIHVSFFEPGTMAEAMRRAGFEPRPQPKPGAFADVIRFKVLKNLGVRKTSILEKVIPWRLLSPIVDSRYRISAHPYGVAS